MNMIWRGDLVRALAETPEDQHDEIAETLRFTREQIREDETIKTMQAMDKLNPEEE